MMPKVWNKRDKNVPANAIYVGRPTVWGNPFSHRPGTRAGVKVDTREDAVAKYKEWILRHHDLVNLAKIDLKGMDLVCWCAPKACHADVLLEVANQ